MKSLFNLKIIIVSVLVLAGLGFGAYQIKNHAAKQAGTEQKTANTPPVQFQPDSQALNQAVNPQDSLNNKNSSSVPPTSVAPGVPAYAYNSQTCINASYFCLYDYYKGVVHNYGVEIAYSDIKQRYTENPVVVNQCHPLMHIIGSEATKRYKTVSEAYLHGDSFCWSGYYHGVMEGVVSKIGLAALPTKLNTICADIPGKASYNFDYYNCVHGLGHGIMETLKDEVLLSLSMCDNLTGDWEKSSCYSGTFMENIIADNNEHNSKFLKPSEPLYPCTIVGDKYKFQCYLGQTSYALQVTGYNFKKIFELCATVTQPYRDICNQSMGRDAANQASHNAQKTEDTCWLATDPNDQTNCVIGAVKEIISYYHAKTQAVEFCAILDDKNKATCNSTADAYYAVF